MKLRFVVALKQGLLKRWTQFQGSIFHNGNMLGIRSVVGSTACFLQRVRRINRIQKSTPIPNMLEALHMTFFKHIRGIHQEYTQSRVCFFVQ